MPVDINVLGRTKTHPKVNHLKTKIAEKREALFRASGLSDPELSVVLTDDEHIRELNARWRGIDEATDVLSFPLFPPEELAELDGDPPALGDIVIDVYYAERLLQTDEHRTRVAETLGLSADDLAWGLDEEVLFLLVHGFLHLLGHDHAEADEEAEMRAEEKRLWLAISDA